MTTDPAELAPFEHAERQVLGSMMLDALAVDDASRVLSGADFASPRHETIHDAVAHLAMSGKPHDPVAVADLLSSTGELSRVGGHAYLTELVTRVVSAAQCSYYAGIVREASLKRVVRNAGVRLQQLSETDGAALDAVSDARAALDSVSMRGQVDVSNADAVDEAIAALDAEPGLPTPWKSLTRTISGWYSTELYVVAARPGIGKSVVGVSAVMDCARRGHTAMLFSLEMSRVELYHRMLSAVSGVDGTRIRHRTLRDRDRADLARAAEHIKGLPLVVHAQTGLTVAQLRTLIRRQQLQGDVGLVVVDYLAKLRPSRDVTRQDRRVQVDSLVWGLKETAIQLDVPVLALAQLNRAIEARTDKRPQLSDLREAGGIEADADVVILMNRARDETEGDPSELGLIVRKNRHGPSDVEVPLIFVGHKSRIVDPEDTAAGASRPA